MKWLLLTALAWVLLSAPLGLMIAHLLWGRHKRQRYAYKLPGPGDRPFLRKDGRWSL
jgi:hypothetical protein